MIELLWKIATLVFYVPWATVLAVVFYVAYFSLIDGLIVAFGITFLYLYLLKDPQ